jgi:plastocyanin
MLGGKPFASEFGVVTLQPAGKKLPVFPTARIMEQRNRAFAPHVLVLPVGSVVTFPNFDPVFHNVFSSSDTKPFDLGLYKSGEAREVVFDHEGTVRLACNLHANMSAYIVVVSAPHYAVTDSSGGFKFTSLDPGTYTLRAYSERSLAPHVEEIVVKPGRNQVTVGVPDDAPTGPLPDKFGVARVAKKS